MTEQILQCQLLTDTAKLPEMAHETDCGFDVFADENAIISPWQQCLVGTGVAIQLPSDCGAFVWPRSGLSVNMQYDTGAGLIDSGYRGEVKVLVRACNKTLVINKGDKIAQIVIQKVERPKVVQVAYTSESDRGNGGFGSSGN